MTATSVSTQYQLGDVNQTNIQQLKALNVATLPVRYSDKFYRELISNYTTEYLKYAVWNGFVVGAVCARVENKENELQKLYIMTINVLAPYRSRGIASKLLEFVTEKATNDSSISEIYLHVQINNLDAKKFYLSHGFDVVETIKNYYKNIEPTDCVLLRKMIVR